MTRRRRSNVVNDDGDVLGRVFRTRAVYVHRTATAAATAAE